MAITIEAFGIEAVQKKFTSMKQFNKVRQAVEQSVLIVERDAIHLCPVDTGNLRNSIHFHMDEGASGKVYTNCEYAPYVEFGTGVRGQATAVQNGAKDLHLSYRQDWAGQIAQPFLYPALEQNKTKIRALIKNAVNKDSNV